MNRYEVLAHYVLRMRNKEIPVIEKEFAFGIKYCLPRLILEKDYDFLSYDYYVKFIMYPKSYDFVAKVKTFRISEKDYNIILRSFK